MSIWDSLFGNKQLDRIELTLKRMETKMSEMEEELDQAIAELTTKLRDLKTAVDALISAIPDGSNLADEIAAVQAALGEAQNITDTVKGATPSTEPPTE